jgi:hypothetical protein
LGDLGLTLTFALGVKGAGGVFSIFRRTSSWLGGFDMAVTYSAKLLAAMKKAEDEVIAHATSIGLLCMAWATLDRMLDPLICQHMRCSQSQVACFAADMDRVSTRCDVLKKLLTIESPSPQWRDWIFLILDRISGEIAPLRNRVIHDHWQRERGQMMRTDRRASIKKPQAGQPEQLIYDAKYAMPTDEIEKLRLRIEVLINPVSRAEQDLRSWRETGRPVVPDPQLIPLSKPNARYQTDQEQAEARKLGRSPSDYVFA